MVTVYVPAGVPLPLNDRPLPQPTHIMTQRVARPKLSSTRRRLAARSARIAVARIATTQKTGISGLWEKGLSTAGPGGAMVRAVVFIVTEACVGFVPSRVTEVGVTVQVVAVSEDGSWQFKDTWALKPDSGVMVTLKCAGVPANSVIEGVEAVIEKSEPLPVSAMTCGLSAALSVIVTLPVRVPPVVGVNTMLMAQLPPAGRVTLQVFPSLKSPLATIPEMSSVCEPLLVSVTCLPELDVPMATTPKSRLVAERATAACGVTFPVKRTTCGLPGALSVIVSAPTLCVEVLG